MTGKILLPLSRIAGLYSAMVKQTQDIPTFALKNVVVMRDEKSILRDISVQVTARRIGIVGRNGSGKTTLARVFAGLVEASSGTVQVDGIDPAKDRKAAINTVGILFQNPDHQIIFPTVEEEIAFGLLQQGFGKVETADIVAKTLAEFGKSHWAKAAIHQLSQGQKQLVCLMSVLAMQPSVVILDEPFSGLDLPTKMQLARYFERITSAIIHISHDPEVLKAYDHVLWIDEGALREQGVPEVVLPAFIDQMQKIGEADDIADLAD
ncbi:MULTISPECIES: energy-coupling factor ABC transporter ATP-binding protein [Pacificibacter]|uniref:energy-coupling factor ABC transporter ATP-binding protein n=1 Tax=Pacificibacter TaxID=1042323 RepID=UPI00209171CD|nr:MULTISPECIES: ABC transporter ATP-binding protein [Pacificibacter]MDO6617387.1 ABC transporter ATP-binding protein [Pacificibacter sp. 1_MG-2023]